MTTNCDFVRIMLTDVGNFVCLRHSETDSILESRVPVGKNALKNEQPREGDRKLVLTEALNKSQTYMLEHYE